MKTDTEPGEETRTLPLWTASRALLAPHGVEFFSRWKKVAKTFDEEDVHDLRVSSRRLREGLTLFSPSFPQKETKGLIREVKKVTRMLGELRNTDEASLFFSGLTAEETAHSRDGVRQILTELQGEREQALATLKRELRPDNREDLRNLFDAVMERPKLFNTTALDPFMSVTFYAAGAVITRLEPIRQLIPPALREDDSVSQHQLRIAIKKLRYRLDIVAPLIEGVYEEVHDALKEYQDLLGKLHDLDVFTEMVQKRVVEGTARDELLRVMTEKRRKLFASFAGQVETAPIESIGAKALQAL